MYLKPSLVHLHSPSIASVERGATTSSKTSATLKPFHLLHGVLNKVYPHQVSKRHPFFPFRSSTRITFLFTTAGHATVILQGPHSSSRRILDSKSYSFFRSWWCTLMAIFRPPSWSTRCSQESFAAVRRGGVEMIFKTASLMKPF